MKHLGTVIRNRNIAVMLATRFVQMSGSWLVAVALSVAIYRYSHGSSLLVGLLWVVRMVPGLLRPLGGKLADQMGHLRAVVIAGLVQAAVIVLLAFSLTPHIWALSYPLAFVFFFTLNLWRTGSMGLMPRLVASREEQFAANATAMTADSLAIAIGSALGGALAGVGLLQPLLLGLGGLYCLTALSTRLLRLFPRPEVGAPAPSIDRGFVAGVRMLAGRPILVFTAGVMVLPELVQGAIFVWLVPYSIHSLHLGDAGSGVLYAALGAGILLGGLATGAFGNGIGLDRLLTVGILAGGVAIVFFGLWQTVVPALLFMLIFGASTSVEYAAFETLIQQAVPESMIGQAVGTMEALFFNMMLVGNLISGVLAALFGIGPSIAAMGSLVILTAVAGWCYLRWQLARIPSRAAISASPALTQLSAGTQEWIALRMVREEFPAGAVVVRQGDAGDTFYTIASGKARVEVAGSERDITRQMGPGEYFGEIALLQQVPRTATVRAVEPLVVYTLSRGDLTELQQREPVFGHMLLQVAEARLGAAIPIAIGWPAFPGSDAEASA